MFRVCNNCDKLLLALLSLITLIQINAEWNTKDYLKREYSLYKPYQGSGMSVPYWDFEGSTMVTKNYIRLTPDSQSTRGAIWNTVPCAVQNWELQVQFKIHGRGKELFGDGFAIWYTRDRMQSGPVFGNMDYFVGLVLIIDTYSNHNGDHNHQHPYISAMINNGSWHYDHDRDGTHTQLAGCEAKLRNLDYDTYISIRYEHDVLTVSTDMENKAAWKECLSVKGVRLPTGYYLGLSAATGDLSDNHDVISVRFFELDMPGDFGPFRLISLSDVDNTTTTFLSRAAQTDGNESEFLQVVKYGARKLDLFLRSHGITIPLPSLGDSGPSLIYDDGSQTNSVVQARGKKKKLALLLPLIAILKLAVIKLILLPILLSTLFIKKMIILAAMGLPSLLSILKICKITPPAHYYHQPAAYSTLDTSEDFSSYGAQQAYYHAKDWGTHPRMYG